MSTEPHRFADGVVIGREPQPGDRIRVTRITTTTEVFEGVFDHTAPTERSSTGPG